MGRALTLFREFAFGFHLSSSLGNMLVFLRCKRTLTRLSFVGDKCVYVSVCMLVCAFTKEWVSNSLDSCDEWCRSAMDVGVGRPCCCRDLPTSALALGYHGPPLAAELTTLAQVNYLTADAAASYCFH